MGWLEGLSLSKLNYIKSDPHIKHMAIGKLHCRLVSIKPDRKTAMLIGQLAPAERGRPVCCLRLIQDFFTGECATVRESYPFPLSFLSLPPRPLPDLPCIRHKYIHVPVRFKILVAPSGVSLGRGSGSFLVGNVAFRCISMQYF